MTEQPLLSIVIPAFKEEKRIHKILDAIIEYEKSKKFTVEVIIVVDGSPDETAEVAEKYKEKISALKIIDRKENKGKGYTVREGIMAAEGKYILFSDADNSTPVEQVDKLFKYKEDYMVIIGSRYIKGGRLAHPQGIIRKLGGRVLNLIIRMFAARGIKDTQCGFKLFEHDAAREIFKRMTFERFSFDIEVLAIARRHKYKIKEVGIVWYDDPHSTVSPIKDGLKMIRDSWRVRVNLAKGVYK
jgi:dolichyl-phosphate beta-glucosyltransferase